MEQIFKKIIFCIIITMISSLLIGCKDAIELEEQAYVIILGFDTVENDEKKLEITYLIANPQIGSSNQLQEPDEPSESIISIISDDAIMARDLVNISVSRKINYSQTKLLIISEEFARNGNVKQIYDEITRDPELRRDTYLLISKEKAKDFINNYKPPFETRIHKNIGYMIMRWEDTGLTPTSTLFRFVQNIEDNTTSYLVGYATIPNIKDENDKLNSGIIAGEIPKKGDNPAQIVGGVVLFHGKMIGKLELNELRSILLLEKYSKADSWYEVFPDPLNENKHITIRLKKINNSYKFYLNNHNNKIDIKVKLNACIMLINSLTNYASNSKNQKILLKSIKEKLSKDAYEVINKSQLVYKSDLFDLSLLARKKFISISQFNAFNWIEKYPRIDINVSFDVTITEFGKNSRSTNKNKFEE